MALLIAALCLPAMAEPSALFVGGSGTAEDTWQISTAEQLTAFAANVNDGSQAGYAGQAVALTADIDLSGVDWTPIGSMADMEGHTVSNLKFATDAAIVGACLFGLNVGEIQSVNMTNATVTCTDGTSQAIAALVGYNMGTVGGCLKMMDFVTNCTADVTIVSGKGGHAIGGLCDYAGTHFNGHCADGAGWRDGSHVRKRGSVRLAQKLQNDKHAQKVNHRLVHRKPDDDWLLPFSDFEGGSIDSESLSLGALRVARLFIAEIDLVGLAHEEVHDLPPQPGGV